MPGCHPQSHIFLLRATATSFSKRMDWGSQQILRDATVCLKTISLGLRDEPMPSSSLHCHTQSSRQQQPSGVLLEEDKYIQVLRALGTFALGSLGELKI